MLKMTVFLVILNVVKDLVEVEQFTLVDSSPRLRMTVFLVILNEVKDLVEVERYTLIDSSLTLRMTDKVKMTVKK